MRLISRIIVGLVKLGVVISFIGCIIMMDTWVSMVLVLESIRSSV